MPGRVRELEGHPGVTRAAIHGDYLAMWIDAPKESAGHIRDTAVLAVFGEAWQESFAHLE